MDGARTLLLNGLAQTDLDMAGFRIINLNTDNLPPVGIPPTVTPPQYNFLNGWDSGSRTWSFAQPSFAGITGNLTSTQQSAISQVGTIIFGTWQASQLAPRFCPSLEIITPPAGNVSLNGQKITNLADPTDPQDAVTKNFMDLLLQGLNPKQAVRVATTAGISLSGIPTIDGVVLHSGDRILVKDQGGARLLQNGIYVVSSATWSRATDADHGTGDVGFNSQNSINVGAYCVVLEGTTQAGTSWFQKDTVVHAATDNKEFVIFSDATTLAAGNGLNLIGNTLNVVGTLGRVLVGSGVDIDPGWIGQNTITTLGTITTGVWNAGIIPPQFGGTGQNNGFTISLEANLSVTLQVGAISGSLQFVVFGSSTITVPPSGTMATLAGNETFNNKWIQKRVVTTATSSAPAIDTDTTDAYYIGALASDITSFTTNLTGTPQFSDFLEIWIKDSGTQRNLAFGTAFTASSDLPLPTHTTVGKWMRLLFQYNATMVKWVLVNFLNNIS